MWKKLSIYKSAGTYSQVQIMILHDNYTQELLGTQEKQNNIQTGKTGDIST